jgi:glycosyltransferase involved in cell wall biosynthesis
VTVIYPYAYMRDNIRRSFIPTAYGIKHNVRTRILLTPLREHSFKLERFMVLLLAFSVTSLRIFLESMVLRRDTLILSRDAKILLPAIALRKLFGRLCRVKVIYIASEVKKDRPIFRWVVRHSNGVMAGVSAARDAIRAMMDVPEERFILSLAPVPDDLFDCSKSEARQKIGYSASSPLIVYTGKLGPEVKELHYILEAARQLPAYTFLFTGGRASSVAAVKSICESKGVTNVIFTGFLQDSTFIRYYQLAADVLVSYYTATDHMVEFNYPQKVNEYLTTGNPVVTPDFPATRDVLNEKNVIFVLPDLPEDLARGIRLALEDHALTKRITGQALRDIKELTFRRRTEELLQFAARLR